MEKDIVWNVFFENEERFADLINGCGLNGKQMVKPEDLKPADTKNLQYYGTDTKGETGKILDVCKTSKSKKRNGKSTKSSTVYRDIVRKVDFIRYSKNKEQVKKLVLNNPDYEKISEDAYDVMKQYANKSELKTEKVEGEKNMVNMAKGLQDWAEEERAEGRAEGRREGIQSMVRIFVKNMLKCGMSDEDILMLSECDRELLEEVKKSIQEKR